MVLNSVTPDRSILSLCTAFQGDSQAIEAAYVEIQSNFRKHAAAPESDVPRLVAEGREAAEFLRASVVQGQLNDRGNYGAFLLSVYVVYAIQSTKSGTCAL